MAELIPLEYRIVVARRFLVSRWTFIVVVAALVAGGSLAYAFGWQLRRAGEFNRLNDQFHQKSALIAKAKELQTRRLELAVRMQKMQQLMDDKILLTLLRNVSDAFSDRDALNSIEIAAHSVAKKPNASDSTDDGNYTMRISGVTASDSSHAELISRLSDIGAKSDPPLNISPESLHRENMLDGQVMRFEISGGKPGASGG